MFFISIHINMLEPVIIYLINHWDSIKRILIYTIPLTIIFGIIILYLFKSHISKNWKDYKSNPFFLFFGGFFNKHNNETTWQATERNFTEYLSTFIKEVYNFLMIPVYSVFHLFQSITKSIYTVINNIRAQMSIMRNFLMKIVSTIFNKISNGTAVATYMFMKIRDGLRKQFGLFNLVSSTIQHSYYFIYSLLAGPLGDMGRYGEEAGVAIAGFTLGAPGIGLYLDTLCFHPDTPIDLEDSQKPIKFIQPGEILKNNNKVLAKIKIASRKQVDIYNYHNILVTGDHLILKNGFWSRVNTLTNEGFTQAYPKLACLITSNGTISINNEIWRDYTDNNNFQINNYVQSKLLEHLNCNNTISSKWNQYFKPTYCHTNEMVWGFHPDTLIYGKKISEIKPGELLDSREVKAIIKIAPFSMNIFKLKNYNLFVSGNVIVNDGKWNKVFQSNWFDNLNELNNIEFFNIVIDNSYFKINGVTFRDYLGTDDKEFNNQVDKFMETSLNFDLLS